MYKSFSRRLVSLVLVIAFMFGVVPFGAVADDLGTEAVPNAGPITVAKCTISDPRVESGAVGGPNEGNVRASLRIDCDDGASDLRVIIVKAAAVNDDGTVRSFVSRQVNVNAGNNRHERIYTEFATSCAASLTTDDFAGVGSIKKVGGNFHSTRGNDTPLFVDADTCQ